MTKILIVDEAEIFLKLERSFLRRAGYDLLLAGNLEDLVSKARGSRPDLVLLHSGQRTSPCGVPCARLLKSDPATSGIPLILIRSREIAPETAALPCERVLDAPVDPHDLLAAISSLTTLRHRVLPRVMASLAVEIHSGSVPLRARTKDLGAGGVFILTRKLLEDGETVRLEVTLPGVEGPTVVSGRGIVVRGVPDDPSSDRIPGNAVRLLDLEEGGRQALDAFLQDHEAAP
jgi:two-component system, cell cycle response regulator DivK